MQTKNLVQTSAKIIRITELQVGNIVKFVEEDSYSGAKMKYAVVSSILNNGEKTFIELVSFTKEYNSGVKLEKKLIAGDEEIAIFPANKADLITDFQEIKEDVQQEIDKKKNELSLMESNFSWLSEKIQSNKLDELTEPKFEEIGN